MTNREWLFEEMKNMSDEEFAENIALPRELREQNKCYVSDVVDWLKSEHKEPITLSEAERIILENIDKDYKWIARDKGDNMHVYKCKPTKLKNYWHGSSSYSLCAFNHLFQFITWEDEEPYNIEELLKQ